MEISQLTISTLVWGFLANENVYRKWGAFDKCKNLKVNELTKWREMEQRNNNKIKNMNRS